MSEQAKEIGQCYICKQEVSKRGIIRHVKSCIKKNISGENDTVLLQIIGGGPFYITMLAPITFKLQDLDDFLREIWYECCGHLSRFNLGQQYNMWMGEEEMEKQEEKIMNKSLLELQNYKQVEYEYDFGSTSYAQVKFLDIVKIKDKIKDFKVISYNKCPIHKCEECGRDATYLINDWNTDKWYFLCDKHSEDQEDDELPSWELNNNPRVGACGDSPDTDEKIKKYLWNYNNG